MKRKIRVYVGCCLTGAPKNYVNQIFKFRDFLQTIAGVEVLLFVDGSKIPEGIDRDAFIYFHDIHQCVGRADLLITEISRASTGLGWEMGTSVEKHGTPLIMLKKKGVKVSSLPLGAAAFRDNVFVYDYDKSIIENACIEFVFSKLQKMFDL